MPYLPLSGRSTGQNSLASSWFAAVAISCAVLSVNVGQAETPAHVASQSVRLNVVDGNDIRFHHLSTEEGLSQTRVAQIVQDDRGFMWFGTQYGLNRFDGYEFHVFAHDPQFRDSLSGVYISSLFKDHAGTIWVGCDPYLERFNPTTESFTHYRLDVPDRDTSPVTISSINEDADAMLWLSTSKGLIKLDPSNGRIVHYRHDSHDVSSIGSDEVKTTGQDRSGQFWIGHSEGLDRFDRRTGKVSLHIPLAESGIGLFFHEDRQGVFWVVYGQYGKLGVFDRRTNTVIPYVIDYGEKSSGYSDPMYAMFEDSNGTMWFGTSGNGLLKLDREHNRFIRYRNNPSDGESLAGDRITALFQDNEGNIWTGLHQAGPNYFSTQPSLFEALANKDGNRMTGLIGAVFEDSRGVIWLASPGKLDLIDRKTKKTSAFKPTAGVDVLSVIEQEPQIFWIATGGKGLVRYNQATGTLTTYRWKRSDQSSLSSDLIERLLISRNGTLWCATWDGLSRFDSGTQRFRSFWPEAGKLGLNFHAIAEDPEGILWLGSNQGLHRFDPASGKFTLYNNNPQNMRTLSDNRVNSVHVDNSGVVWAGTQNGLDKFDPGTKLFTNYYQRDGLAGNVVSCILEDKRGVLWMSTNNGVSSFEPHDKRFGNYGVADGLPGIDLTGWGACSKSASGEMFFGGFSGAAAFQPERAAQSAYIPPIFLTSFRLFGTEMSLRGASPLKQSIVSATSITLAHWQNFFSLKFAALNYASASTNRYRYKLEGLDQDWIEADSERRLANYTSVSPAIYTFRVQGATSRGLWGEPGVILKIEVLPAWWNSIWFRSSSFFLVGLAMIMLYRLRLRQTARQLSVRYEERLTERTRIARELHDTLLQSFHGLVFRFQAARNMLPDRWPEAIQTLDGALDEADRALNEGRVAIQGLRSESVMTIDLATFLTAAGQTFVSNQAGDRERVAFGIAVEGERQSMQPILQEQVHKIASELMQNAFQHAEARHIEVELRYDRHEVRLRIRDDGKGIDPRVVGPDGRPGHWGIVGMRERAKQIGARLEFWSEAGAGTEAELIIPGAIAYRKQRASPRPGVDSSKKG